MLAHHLVHLLIDFVEICQELQFCIVTLQDFIEKIANIVDIAQLTGAVLDHPFEHNDLVIDMPLQLLVGIRPKRQCLLADLRFQNFDLF